MTKTAIALGGNIGNVKAAFNEAIILLMKGGMQNIRISEILTNPAVGCVPDTPDFKNAALTGIWNSSVEELLKICQTIEAKLGRPKEHQSNMSRTVDLDIILFGSEIIKSNCLTIPHPRAHLREFVLLPLSQIAQNWILPDTSLTVLEALKNLKSESNITVMR